jgi:hypothetical protein
MMNEQSLDRLEVGKATKMGPIKPLNLIVITDGEADDPDTLAYALAGFSDRLELGRFPLNQLGVQFIQIGNDRNATKFLKSLDDELRSESSGRRDIVVSFFPLNPQSYLYIVVEALSSVLLDRIQLLIKVV